MPDGQLIGRGDLVDPQSGRTSPMDRIISDLDGTYFKMSEVAEIVGCSISTLRRMKNKPGVSAPSLAYQQGDAFVYLYTPKDVEEVKSVLARNRIERGN